MPQALVDGIKRASTFNEGFETAEHLSAALVDMELHLAGDTPIDPDGFERVMLVELGMPREIVMRHRTPQFGHVFAGDGYSAGYYSYLWSDVITAYAYGVHRGGRTVRQDRRGAAQAAAVDRQYGRAGGCLSSIPGAGSEGRSAHEEARLHRPADDQPPVMRLQKVHARVGVALISISLLNCRGDPTSLSDVLRERILLWRGYGSSGEILFLSLRSPREISTMYVMDTAGTNAEMLGGDGACTGPVYEARWSPEGNRIAYSCAMPLDLAIHTIEANGTGVTRISQPDPQSGRNNDFFPAWSPDGRRIAFTSDGPDIETHATYDLYVMRLDGTRARVTTDSTWDLVSDWGRPR